ncbi:CRAL-TRIO domain-containing protein [Aspergillus lucknowensis]|uniref:CRAL-TRIO domain-containing protein n=1 Tax=Aspergillus lucknowensis TaxID=176173 RepID=A0ABR4M7K2_9EURO
MAVLPTTGYVGNLTPTEEAKLRDFWTLLFTTVASLLSTVYDVPLPEGGPTTLFKLLANVGEPTANGILAALRGEAASSPAVANGATASAKALLSELSREKVTRPQLDRLFADLRKAGVHDAELKAMEKILVKMSPVEMCVALLKMVKQEHPDTLLLRFLRARKWDIPRAFGMMANAILWRKSFEVDEDVVPRGELDAWRRSRDEGLSEAERKEGKDFIMQLEMGKSYLHGLDREGRPVNIVRVRLHKPGAQSQAALERYIVHVIESTRILVAPPVETGTILFDMTGFSLSNMEYSPVKFIIQCFEANYPESLGRLLIHNAPWIFSGIWKIIHGWMDPVVASKVQFTKSIDDLDKFIPRAKIPKELGGDEDFEYSYLEPKDDENATMQDSEARDTIMIERMMIGLKLVAATAAWISAASPSSKSTEGEEKEKAVEEAKKHRDEVIKEFQANYWKLDPYVRARALIDRTGAIAPDGTVNDY